MNLKGLMGVNLSAGVALALSLASPFARGDQPCVSNPWHELTSQARQMLTPLLSQPVDANVRTVRDDSTFAAWYHRYFCSEKADSDWNCPDDNPSPENAYAEYRYNALEVPARISTACLAEQFVLEGVWAELISPAQSATITYADRRSSLIVKMKNPEAFKTFLGSHGYVTDFCGGPKDNGTSMPIYCGGPHSLERAKVWGLRSAQNGPALHWYQTAAQRGGGELAVHIDFENPGLYTSAGLFSAAFRGFHHFVVDKLGWDKRTLGLLLHTEFGACGIGPTDTLIAARYDATDGLSTTLPDRSGAASEGEPGAQCVGPRSLF